MSGRVGIALVAGLAACATPSAPVTPSVIAPPVAPAAAPGSNATRYVFRRLATGMAIGSARRATFTLLLDGDRATLVQTEETARVSSLAAADAAAAWVTRSTTTYTGTRAAGGGREIALALTTPGQQPLALTCAPAPVRAAAAGAILVRAPGQDGGCDGSRATWSPAATTAVTALICTPPGEAAALPDDPAGDTNDEDHLVFGPAPGLEHASENDDCNLQGGGLRAARP